MTISNEELALRIASITEPADGALGHTIAEVYVPNFKSVGAAYRQFIADLDAGVVDRPTDIDEQQWAKTLERWHVASEQSIERGLVWLQRAGIKVTMPGMEDWPERMEFGHDSPLVLFYRGDLELLRADRIAGVVGARASTGYGEHVTHEIVNGLVQREVATVSGGAYGIDAAAHRATLAAGGKTIAFMAGGVDRLYPQGNEGLFTRIIQDGGLIASEVLPGSAPSKWRFLQRNRLIAGAGDALVVVEAGLRSGSLNAAGHAKRLGTPVGAVPGPITSAASQGTNRLIREGATVVTSAEDLLELMR